MRQCPMSITEHEVKNPYLLDTPAVVSFSGGRTSGYMLWHILQAFGGTLPDDVKVIFNNTGKERPETLDFVERCSQQWGVPVTWLEYRYHTDGSKGKTRTKVEGHTRPGGRAGYEVVDYATASRNGEPFANLITARNMLPNPVARFCTVELKIRTTQRYLKGLGWESWTNAVGLRADEPHRVARLGNKGNQDGCEEPVAPLAAAGVTIDDINDFWCRQPFKLELQQHEGNCDLCFLKGAGKIRRMLKERPDLADWWIQQEERIPRSSGGTDQFRRDRASYRIQLQLAQRPGLFDGVDEPDELSSYCSCTD